MISTFLEHKLIWVLVPLINQLSYQQQTMGFISTKPAGKAITCENLFHFIQMY